MPASSLVSTVCSSSLQVKSHNIHFEETSGAESPGRPAAETERSAFLQIVRRGIRGNSVRLCAVSNVSPWLAFGGFCADSARLGDGSRLLTHARPGGGADLGASSLATVTQADDPKASVPQSQLALSPCCSFHFLHCSISWARSILDKHFYHNDGITEKGK